MRIILVWIIIVLGDNSSLKSDRVSKLLTTSSRFSCKQLLNRNESEMSVYNSKRDFACTLPVCHRERIFVKSALMHSAVSSMYQHTLSCLEGMLPLMNKQTLRCRPRITTYRFRLTEITLIFTQCQPRKTSCQFELTSVQPRNATCLSRPTNAPSESPFPSSLMP